jgi:SAM-dependent methyltransferase
METYFSGTELYGDDFSFEEIRQWYEDEKEGYANLVVKYGLSEQTGGYDYMHLNIWHGFRFLPPDIQFERALGLGSALGDEFLPVIDRIKSVYVIEPSDQFHKHELKGVPFRYQKPSIEGKMNFENDTFQLATSFGTLHHIPNVSFVLSELHRCLAPGGYLLIREPIISMGDWRRPRHGLTKRERGIPLAIFRARIQELGFEVVQERFCFAMTSFLQRKIGHLFGKPLHAYKWYVIIDSVISRWTIFNLRYHALNIFQRIAPTSVFYVLRKK